MLLDTGHNGEKGPIRVADPKLEQGTPALQTCHDAVHSQNCKQDSANKKSNPDHFGSSEFLST
jgi:hypothetical protein